MRRLFRPVSSLVFSTALTLVTGCAPVPLHDTLPEPTLPPAPALHTELPPPERDNREASLGDELAVRAIAMVGIPYRYGGADLNGFDCSGLVYYLHRELGVEVPRTAADQQSAAATVELEHLKPGDLVFFHTHGRGVSHVGIYVGGARFVHAPQSGRLIELRSLDDGYYGPRLVSAGRLVRG